MKEFDSLLAGALVLAAIAVALSVGARADQFLGEVGKLMSGLVGIIVSPGTGKQ